MTVLTTIPNGANYKDIRDTWNAALADLAALKAGGTTPTPTPTSLSLSSAVSQAEGNSGTVAVTTIITVARNGIAGALTVNLSYTGSATSGADYQAGPATVVVPSGQNTGAFDLNIIGDVSIEGDETIIITATLAAYPTISASRVITITNDDTASGFTTIVHEGDSISSNTPGVDSGSYAWQYKAFRTDKTINVRAQGSRVAIRNGVDGGGNPVYFVDGDGQNSVGSHVTEDVTTYGAQLVTYMIGTNDMAAMDSAPQYRSDITMLYGRYAAKGTKVAWSGPTPLNSETQPDFYAGFMAKRADVLSTCRDPSVWGQWADYYFPMGECPDLIAGGNALFADTVHPNLAGQAKMYAMFKQFMDSLLDGARISSTVMYHAAWPTGATGLATSTTYTYRFIISGLAHMGIALTGGNSLAATNATLSINGDVFAANKTGWLYNGDAIDLKIVTGAAANTPFDVGLTIGTETRTLTFRTAIAATQAVLTPGSFVDYDGSTAISFAFPSAGLGLIALLGYLPIAPTVTYKGVSCAQLGGRYDPYRGVWWYSVPVVALTAGALTISGSTPLAAWYATAEGVDATPVASSAILLPDVNNPTWSTGALSVPVSGLAVSMMGVFDTTTLATVSTGTSVFGGYGALQNGERYGLAVAKRVTPGPIVFNLNQYSEKWLATLVFKAAGT